MFVHDFRWVIRIFVVPELFIFVLFWLIPESYRWLLVTGRVDRAIATLKRIAKFNGKTLSKSSIELIKKNYSPKSNPSNDIKSEANESVLQRFLTAFTSKRLCMRLLNCFYLWIACAFTYYGVSLSSTQISGVNRYVSLIIVSATEIPSLFLAQPLFNRFKRRILLSVSISMAATSIIVTPFVPTTNSWIILVLFMIGKGSITFAFNGLYIFTIEQWPTNIRSTILNTCSMVGRVGSMVSTLAVILVRFYLTLFTSKMELFLIILCLWTGRIWITPSIFIRRHRIFSRNLCSIQPRNLWQKIARHNWRSGKYLRLNRLLYNLIKNMIKKFDEFNGFCHSILKWCNWLFQWNI